MMNPILQQDIEVLAALPAWEKLRGKTLLITGATGMLGATLALAADAASRLGGWGIKLLLLGRNRKRAEALYGGAEATLIFQDVRQPLRLTGPVDYILHTAGPVGPAVFERAPAEVLAANVAGTLALLDLAVDRGCAGFVFASTHEIYGKAEGLCAEDTPLCVGDSMAPRACYVLGKQAAENALACFHKQHGLRAVSARLSRLYGPLMNLSSGLFVADFIREAAAGRPVQVHGGGGLLRPLCHVRDAAAAMLLMLTEGAGGQAYNVQGAELPTIAEVARLVAALAGVEVTGIGLGGAEQGEPAARHSIGEQGAGGAMRSPLEIPGCAPEGAARDVAPASPPAVGGTRTPRGHHLNTTKLQALGWRQTLPLAEGLARTLAAFKAEGEGEAAAEPGALPPGAP